MDEDLTFAYAVARALIKGKSTEELARLQIILQTVSSLVAAELASQRLKATTEKPNG
ncbi:MAG: hypothetical protein J5765_00260 [Clostridia bacterium]|nr:hypothetical protein [Clostridia bacterium]